MLVEIPTNYQPIHFVTNEVYSSRKGEVSPIIVKIGIDSEAPKGTDYTNTSYQNFWERYFVSGIFTAYGKPEKIFLDTTRLSGDPTTQYPFVLWIVYPKQGFLMRYAGINNKVGENIKICPMQSKIEITIWDTKKTSYEEFIKNDSALAKPLALGPQPIEEVTEFDIDSFYEKFKNSEINTCFDTPASLWPPY